MNIYYESRISELEEKLQLLNQERQSVEIKTRELGQLRSRELELEFKQKDVDRRKEELEREWDNLNLLKKENKKLKDEVDLKILMYQDILKNKVKCTLCDKEF